MDSNIFAILTAHGSSNPQKFALERNKPFFHPSRLEFHDVGSKESTPCPQSDEPDPYLGVLDRIVLRFDIPPRNFNGWWFGKSEYCDIKLEQLPQLSRRHFYISIEDNGIPFLVNKSTNGIRVKYNGQMSHSDIEKAVLAMEPGQEQPWNEVVIQAAGFEFKIEFPNHNKGGKEYVQRISTFKALYGEYCPPLGHLGLESSITTVAGTPRIEERKSQYVKEKVIGRGSFAVVYKVMEIRTGKHYAMKEFTKVRELVKEMRTMQAHPHPCIIKIIECTQTPTLAIVMEYCSFGSLIEFGPSEKQSLHAFVNVLEAGAFLHRHGIVHRDIKGENILVKGDPFQAILADFGLAKQLDKGLTGTFCGTRYNVAPEVVPKITDDGYRLGEYDQLCDVWSIGITFLCLGYNFHPSEADGNPLIYGVQTFPAYHQNIRDFVDDLEDDDQWALLLRGMLVEDPSKRLSCQACLDKGRKAGLFIFDVLRERYEASDRLNSEDSCFK